MAILYTDQRQIKEGNAGLNPQGRQKDVGQKDEEEGMPIGVGGLLFPNFFAYHFFARDLCVSKPGGKAKRCGARG
jgi:hypothetical protein